MIDQSQGEDFVELSGCVFCDSLELAAGPDKKKAHKKDTLGKVGEDAATQQAFIRKGWIFEKHR